MASFIDTSNNGLTNFDKQVVQAAVEAIKKQTGLPTVDPVVQAAVEAIQKQNGLPTFDNQVVQAAIKAIKQQTGLHTLVDPAAQAAVDNAIPQQNGLSTGTTTQVAATSTQTTSTQTTSTQTESTARGILSNFKDGANEVSDAMKKFGKIFGNVSFPSITFPSITFPMEGQMRRGPINFAQTVTIANTADPTKNPTEHKIFDTDVITPTYETNDFFPDSYDIAFAMGSIMDKTPELNALNAGIEAQLKLLSAMIEHVNQETDKLKK